MSRMMVAGLMREKFKREMSWVLSKGQHGYITSADPVTVFFFHSSKVI